MPSRTRNVGRTASRNVTVKIGTLAGSARSFTVPSATTVSELVGKLGVELESGEEVLDSSANAVDLNTRVLSGQEYTIASNLKAQ